MPAAHITEITDDAIANRLDEINGVTVEWMDHPPRDAEFWQLTVSYRLSVLKVADVRKALEQHDLMGGTAANKISQAIVLACQPDNFPLEGMVDLHD